MLRRLSWPAFAGVCILLCGCESGRHSAAGFRLAENGSIERGKQAFVDLQCYTCHEVANSDLPKPTAQPLVPVVLGGVILREKTDGYLAASIMNPSHAIGGHPKELVMVGDRSRMPEFADRITLRQLTDLVEFLQSTYKVRPPETNRFAY